MTRSMSPLMMIALHDPIMNALFHHQIKWADVEVHESHHNRCGTPCDLPRGSPCNLPRGSPLLIREIPNEEPLEFTTQPKVTFAPQPILLGVGTPLQQLQAIWKHAKPTLEAPFQPAPFQPAILFNPKEIKTIVARNLPRDSTEEELHDIFDTYGGIRDIYLPRCTDKNSTHYGTLKGFALIKYHRASDSTRAFLAEGTRTIRGKKMAVEFAKEDR